MVIELSVDDFLGRGDDRLSKLWIKLAQRHIGLRCGPLDDAQSPDDGDRLLLPANFEILQRPLSLGAPITVGSDLNGAEGVGLDARGGHPRLPVSHPAGLAAARDLRNGRARGVAQRQAERYR